LCDQDKKMAGLYRKGDDKWVEGWGKSPVWTSHPDYVMWPHPSHLNPKGEGNMFFKNTGIHIPHYVSLTS
jgi:hypothetical protein